MARTSPVHYIAPSAISITPNANGTYNDLAVNIEQGTRIKVFSPEVQGLGINPDNNSYREWNLTGRNRSLRAGDGPYTIYARLEKGDFYRTDLNAYLVFARRFQYPPDNPNGLAGEWFDKYSYVMRTGLAAQYDDRGFPRVVDDENYWWVKLGEVSEVAEGQRTVDLDTGILGTDQYNEQWELNPDGLPLRVELTCVIDDKEMGQTPYVNWDKTAELTAHLIEGWETDADSRVHHWTIYRHTGHERSDAEWNGDDSSSSYEEELLLDDDSSSSGEPILIGRLMPDGHIDLQHIRGELDDFDGAVAATFTVTAWGHKNGKSEPSDSSDSDSSSDTRNTDIPASLNSEDSSSSSGDDDADIVPLAKGIITMLAETTETYLLETNTTIVNYDPRNDAYTPEEVVVHVRAKSDEGTVYRLTQEQIEAAMLSLYYLKVGADVPIIGPDGPPSGDAEPIASDSSGIGPDDNLRNTGIPESRNAEDSSSSSSSSSSGSEPIELVFADGQAVLPATELAGSLGVNFWLLNGARMVVDWTTVGLINGGANGDTPISCFRWYHEGVTPLVPTDLSSDEPAAADGDVVGEGYACPPYSWSSDIPDQPNSDYSDSSEDSDSSSSEPTPTKWVLWMCSSVRYGDGTRRPWSGPVRISGEDGDPGADAKNREWIYIGTDTYSNPYSGTFPSDIEGGHVHGDDQSEFIPKSRQYTVEDYVPTGWRDNAIAVDPDKNIYVYASWRDYDPTTNRWSDFADPILWGNWGHQGIDGDGVQYIYKRFANELTDAQCASNDYIPDRPENPNQNGEYIPIPDDPPTKNNDWYDDPVTPTNLMPFCYCCVLRKIGGEWEAGYGKLALWSKWSPNGDTPIQLFKWFADDETVAKPTVTTQQWFDGTSQSLGGWSKTAPNREAGKDLYMSQNTLLGNNTIDSTAWTTPVRISGEDGDPGADAKEREWIYKKNNVQSTPGGYDSKTGTVSGDPDRPVSGKTGGIPNADLTDDFVPGDWSDNAIAVNDSTNLYVYASWRDYDKTNNRWGDFATPILWSNWGQQGIDGDGVQYIYKLFDHELNATERFNQAPDNATLDTTTKEWMPRNETPATKNNDWHDDAPSPTSSMPFCYCSVIKKIHGQWQTLQNGCGKFETLALWSKWSADGTDGSPAPYYTEQSFAWSARKSTASATTEPDDITKDGSGKSIWYSNVPSEETDKPFLWMRVGEYRWNIATDQYVLHGSYTYTRLTGESGTGIQPKGSFSYNDWHGSYNSIASYLLAAHPSPSTGDCYIYQEDGHLWVWNGTVWQDVGQIKGDSGASAYVHFAWAHTLGTGTNWTGQNTGFSTTKQPSDVYEYIGVLSDSNVSDPDITRAGDYTWNMVKGADGVSPIVLDLDNETDSILYSASNTKLSENVETTWHLYQGATEISNQVTRNSTNCTINTNNTCTATWKATTGTNAYRTVQVTAIADNVTTATVAINIIYNGVTYTQIFTVKKLKGVNKYDIVLSTNAVAVNVTTDGTSGSTAVNVKVYKTDSNGGGRSLVSSLSSEGLKLYFNPVSTTNSETSTEVTNSYSSGYTGTVAHDKKEYRVILTDNKTTPTELDRETIPITKVENGVHGASAVRLDLDNENDTMLYNTDGTKVTSNDVLLSTWRLFEGGADITSQVTRNSTNCTISASGCTAAWLTSGETGYIEAYRTIKVSALSGNSGYVTVSVTYNSVTYTTKFNVKRLYGTAKYEIITDPTAITYNTSTSELSASQIKVLIYKTENGQRTKLTSLPSGLYLYGVGVSSNGTESWPSSPASYGSNGYTLTVSSTYAAYRIVLLSATHSSSDAANTIDSETVPISKVANGQDGEGSSPWVADLTNEMDSVACDADGHPVQIGGSNQTVQTVVTLFYGSQPHAFTAACYWNAACTSPYAYPNGTAYQGVKVTWEASSGNDGEANVTVEFMTGTTAGVINGKHNIYIKLSTTDGNNTITRILTFTINGLRPGADGKSPTVYNLLPSQAQVKVDRTSTGFTPATVSIKCGVVSKTGDSAPVVTEDATGTIGGEYSIFFRRRTRGSSGSSSASGSTSSGSAKVTGYSISNVTATSGMSSTGSNGTYTLNGGHVDGGKIIRKITITASASTTIKIKITPSSEANYDFGAVGKSGSTALEYATAQSVKEDTGTNCLVKASGTTSAEETVTIPSGTSFFEIAYMKDGSSFSNNDNAVFVFEEVISGGGGSTPISTDGGFEGEYYKYGYAMYKAYVTSLNVATYDAVEFILYKNTTSTKLQTITESYVIDRETVPIVSDGAQGANGQNGTNGYSVVANPASVVLGESLTSVNTFNVPQRITFSVQGNSSVTVTNVAVGTKSNVAATRYNSTTISIDDVANKNSKPTQGYVTTNVSLSDGTTKEVKVLIAINWQGYIKTTIEGSIETTVAQKVNTAIQEGDFVTQEDLGVYVRSDSQAYQQLTTTVNGLVTDVSTIQQTSSEIEMLVSGNGENILTNSEFNPGSGVTAARYTPDGWTSNDTSKSYVYGNSSLLHLEGHVVRLGGSTSYYLYQQVSPVSKMNTSGWNTLAFYCKASTDPRAMLRVYLVMSGTIATAEVDGKTVSLNSDSIGYYADFSTTTTDYVRHTIRLKFSSLSSFTVRFQPAAASNGSVYPCYIAWPQLFKTLTSGIDIKKEVVDIKADNFSVHNSSGEQTLGLNANGDFEVGGTVKAKNFFHNVCYFIDGGNCINGGTDYTKSGYSYKTAGYADVIMMMPSTTSSDWSHSGNSGTILLPDPSTCDGKMVTVMCTAMTANSGTPAVGCVGNNKFTSSWTYNSLKGLLVPGATTDTLIVPHATLVKTYKYSSGTSGSKVEDSWKEEPGRIVLVSQNGYWFKIEG